jgi:protein ImuA
MFWTGAIPQKPVGPNPVGQPDTALLRDLRLRIARIERGAASRQSANHLPFGIAAIDQHLPGGGLALGALHEMAGAGPDTEHGTAATLLVAGVLARLSGPVLWVVERSDLFAPGLAGAGLHPECVLFVEAGRQVLPVMEEGLRHTGLAAVVGEIGERFALTASRRLQLAAEHTGTLAIALRRSRDFDDKKLAEPTAATTRWRVACLPSPPALAHAPATQGLGRALWRLDLLRCRGGEAGSWTVEACDAEGRLALAANLADRSAAQDRSAARERRRSA